MVIWKWWIFNFLQSVTTVVFDLRSILATHEKIGFEEWSDLSMLVVCTYLFAITAIGKIGIRFTYSRVTKTLLNPFVGHQGEAK